MDPTTWGRALEQVGLAGKVPNSREANMRAVRQLLEGVPFYTFGIRLVHQALALGMLDEEGVVALMAETCGQTGATAFREEGGYISPDRTVEAIGAAAALLERVLRTRSPRIAFGTGHPGALVTCYQRLANHLVGFGAIPVAGPVGAPVGVDWVLDMVGDVVVTSDTCGILHGHGTRAMEALLEGQTTAVDLVVADHGHAGAAINAGIPTIALMDTNDPALALAARLGAPDLVVIPCFDNRPNAVSVMLADLLTDALKRHLGVLT